MRYVRENESLQFYISISCFVLELATVVLISMMSKTVSEVLIKSEHRTSEYSTGECS
jgi:hypothetical protein